MRAAVMHTCSALLISHGLHAQRSTTDRLAPRRAVLSQHRRTTATSQKPSPTLGSARLWMYAHMFVHISFRALTWLILQYGYQRFWNDSQRLVAEYIHARTEDVALVENASYVSFSYCYGFI